MNTAAGIDDGGRGFRRGVSDIRTGNYEYCSRNYDGGRGFRRGVSDIRTGNYEYCSRN